MNNEIDNSPTRPEKPSMNPLVELTTEIRNQVIAPLTVVAGGRVSDTRKKYATSASIAKRAVCGVVLDPLHKWFGRVIPELARKANNENP